MATEPDILQDLFADQIEELLQADSELYLAQATPLKSAQMIKEEHRRQLEEQFKQKELREQINLAYEQIVNLLPNFISPEEFEKVKKEIDGSQTHFVEFVETVSNGGEREKPIFLQEMFGFSDSTILHVYALASDLVRKGNAKDAYSLFVFAGVMAPFVASYWIGQGVCLKALGRNQEAITPFEIAKLWDPLDPLPSAHLMENYLIMNEKEKAKVEYEALANIVQSLEGDEGLKWKNKLNNFRIS